jgi:hypothetical protein
MLISEVVSGGQTGVDRGALEITGTHPKNPLFFEKSIQSLAFSA